MELELHVAEILAPTDEINDIEVPDTVVGSCVEESAAIGCICQSFDYRGGYRPPHAPGILVAWLVCRRKFIGRMPVLG